MSSISQNLTNKEIRSDSSNHEASEPFWTRVTSIGTKTLELTRMVSQLAIPLPDGSLDEQPPLGIASTRRSFFAHRKSFYRGFLIAVPAFPWRWNFCLVGMSCCEKHPAQFRLPFPRVQLNLTRALAAQTWFIFNIPRRLEPFCRAIESFSARAK
jgi:hypothetical protein